MIKTRATLVGVRTELVKARGLAKSLGYRLPRCAPASLPNRVGKDLGLELSPGLRQQMETIELLSQKITELDRQIEQLSCERYPQTALLMHDVFHPGRFRKSRVRRLGTSRKARSPLQRAFSTSSAVDTVMPRR